MATPASGVQFGRSAQLLLVNQNTALDLSNLRFRFVVEAADVETPNIARIRVYNLSDVTLHKAITEYSGVILGAGYGSNNGTIFKGTVKQFRRGKERNVDSFLDIFAADSDIAYNFGVINSKLKAGSTNLQRLQAMVDAAANAEKAVAQSSQIGIALDQNAGTFIGDTGGILPRGKVMFGLARDYLRDFAETNDMRWSIQNGVITLIPNTKYLPGQVVDLNSATGLIGVPEATDQGIRMQSLLNPRFRIGGQVRLNNKDITSTTIKEQFFPGYTDFNLIASVDSGNDGLYRIIVIEHEGDTRDIEWYTRLTCLLINPDTQSVLPFGVPG